MYTYKTECQKPKGRIIWLHGWGLDHRSLLPLAKYFSDYENVLVDFNGFGRSEPPASAYGVPEYMEEVRKMLLSFTEPMPTYVVGHSFGGRIAIELASSYPDSVSGLILLASAGLRKKRSLFFKIKALAIKYAARLFPGIKLGSPDYLKAVGVMRKVFVKVINHDQQEIASRIKCPSLIIYGEKDTETPPEFGLRFSRIIPESRLFILKNLGHLTILTDGRYQVQNLIENFLPPAD